MGPGNRGEWEFFGTFPQAQVVEQWLAFSSHFPLCVGLLGYYLFAKLDQLSNLVLRNQYINCISILTNVDGRWSYNFPRFAIKVVGNSISRLKMCIVLLLSILSGIIKFVCFELILISRSLNSVDGICWTPLLNSYPYFKSLCMCPISLSTKVCIPNYKAAPMPLCYYSVIVV